MQRTITTTVCIAAAAIICAGVIGAAYAILNGAVPPM